MYYVCSLSVSFPDGLLLNKAHHGLHHLHMGQDIGTTILKLTGGEGLGLGLESTEFIQGSSPSLASVYPYTLPGLTTCGSLRPVGLDLVAISNFGFESLQYVLEHSWFCV